MLPPRIFSLYELQYSWFYNRKTVRLRGQQPVGFIVSSYVQLVRGRGAQEQRETKEAGLLERGALRVTAGAGVRGCHRDLFGLAKGIEQRGRRFLETTRRTRRQVLYYLTKATKAERPTAASSLPSVVAPTCSDRHPFSDTVMVRSVSSRRPELAAHPNIKQQL